MNSKRIYFKIIWNFVIACLLSAGSESHNSASIEQAHSNYQLKLHSEFRSKRELNSLVQMASAECSFFLMLFGLGQRARNSVKVNYSVLFANEVEEVATKANEPVKPTIRDFDSVANGEGPGITWTKIHPNAFDYISILETVIPSVDLMTRNKSIRHSEVERLRQFAQGALEFRSRLVHSDDKATIVEMWYEIIEKLTKVLSEPGEHRTWTDTATVNLYDRAHYNGQGIFSICNYLYING